MISALVLNASYEPMSIVGAKRAVNLILSGKAAPLELSTVYFNAKDAQVQLPYVIKLNYFVKKQPLSKPAGFSKKGIMVRDNYKCAYCNKAADTIDHVIPKSLGGESSYENCVASCLKCNAKKSNKLIHEVGYTLTRPLKAPSLYNSLLLKVQNDESAYHAWSQYIFMFQPESKH